MRAEEGEPGNEANIPISLSCGVGYELIIPTSMGTESSLESDNFAKQKYRVSVLTAIRSIYIDSYASLLLPHCPVTVVQRYRDGVCSLLFHLFFIICHPYIPLHFLYLYTIHQFYRLLEQSSNNESKIIKYYTLTLIITMNIRYMLCVILCTQLFKK